MCCVIYTIYVYLFGGKGGCFHDPHLEEQQQLTQEITELEEEFHQFQLLFQKHISLL
jgi:hypothetical protein